MKKRVNLSLDESLVNAARPILDAPPKKSLSAWVEEKLAELITKHERGEDENSCNRQ